MPIKKPAMKSPAAIATEAQEQEALFKWAKFNEPMLPDLLWLFHIPNGGKRDIITATRLKAQGVKAGVPDLCLPVPRARYHGLYIEMKRVGATTTDPQDEWLAHLSNQGYKTAVCEGWVEAADTIKRYLIMGAYK